MNHNISNVMLPQTFLSGKIYIKKFWKKTNIDTINWKKLFDRSAEHKQGNTPWLVNFKCGTFKFQTSLRCQDNYEELIFREAAVKSSLE